MALQNYEGSITIKYNGSALADAKSMQVATKSNIRTVKTMGAALGGGVAGWASGVHESEVTIESATPVGGLEVDYRLHMRRGTIITIEADIGSKTLQYQGKIDSIDWNASAEGDDTTHSIKVLCGAELEV